MITNETKIYLEFNTRVSMRLAGKLRLLLFGCAAVILVCGGVVLGLEIPRGKEADYFFAILLLALGVFFAILGAVYQPFMRLALKKSMQGKESVQRYAFAEDGYEQVAVLNDGTESRTQGNYAAFAECREFSDMWLLFLNKSTIFAVSKSGMKEGSAEELTALFMRVFAHRYKTCFKRK